MSNAKLYVDVYVEDGTLSVDIEDGGMDKQFYIGFKPNGDLIYAVCINGEQMFGRVEGLGQTIILQAGKLQASEGAPE